MFCMKKGQLFFSVHWPMFIASRKIGNGINLLTICYGWVIDRIMITTNIDHHNSIFELAFFMEMDTNVYALSLNLFFTF